MTSASAPFAALAALVFSTQVGVARAALEAEVATARLDVQAAPDCTTEAL
jgi:hypothetical protein